MAVFADIRCAYVSGILAGRFGTVVAADAITHDIQVVKIRGQPAKRAVAVVAGIAAGDMSLVLARCRSAVMAGAAHAYHLGVINGHHRRKDVGCMTVLTHIRGLNMCRAFAGSVYAIVAADTVSRDIRMVEIGRQPGDGTVAIVAIVATGNMSLVLAGRRKAIMTGTATTHYLRVIDDSHRHERNRRVTVFTDLGRANVSRTFADCICAVVTRGTAPNHLRMINGRYRR